MPTCCSSKAFFYAQGVTIVGEMLAPPLGAYLMDKSLWSPIIIGFICLLLAVWLTVLMPETRFTALARDSQDDEHAHRSTGSSEPDEIPGSRASKVEFDVKSRLEAAAGHTLSVVGFVLQHRNLVLLMAGFFSTDFAQQSLAVLLRYVSARYSISLAKVTSSLSFQSLDASFAGSTCISDLNLYDDGVANLRTVQNSGQLFVLLPGLWANAGIWHHPPPP
jgi:hypothetical protein